ncbi:hypothetical protein BGZ95_007164 [Linnemannia exigua]|uniref:Uncharacterized protein n=1 Tax=Linnemannia exigua TaxID=604196 RepID=A0AAD4DFC2_9FUNG|nr:hypothetical protein BGZ95_007164 [Linnemannia exigua]
MAALINHFDGGSPVIGDATEGSWISTYSRGLCSMYHNDEDHCWEAILSTQSSNAFASDDATLNNHHQRPSLQSNRRHGQAGTHAHHRQNGVHNQTSDYFSDIGMEPSSRANADDDPALDEADVGARLAPTSPGSGLSQALCNFGFSCIDFVTGDNLASSSEPVSVLKHHSDCTVSSSSAVRSHDTTLDSAHVLEGEAEDGLEADSTILEDKKGSSWTRRVWRAL